MDENTFTNNNIRPDNLNPSAPTTWNQKYFKVLVTSNFIFLTSLIIFMTLGILADQKGDIFLTSFYILMLSGLLAIASGSVTAISTIYTFFKTIKKKDPVSHAHNIFSRYIIAACLISAIYLFLIFKVFDLYLYLKTNNLEIIDVLPFLLIDIAGFIHLTILNSKYRNHQQSSPDDML